MDKIKAGYLSQYFRSVAVKRLSAVEADSTVSNQHEFNGVSRLRQILGEPADRKHYETRFVYLNDDDEPVSDTGTVTWYDARRNHPHRTEWRLYYPGNRVMDLTKEGDALFICVNDNDSLFLIIAQAGTTAESQLLWLFHIDPAVIDPDVTKSFELRHTAQLSTTAVITPVRYILENIGVEVFPTGVDYMEIVSRRYSSGFPSTHEFSTYTRRVFSDTDPVADPDSALTYWLEHEEGLFRALESHLISEQLQQGFMIGENVDVDSFIAFSLSVQNRRKSRAGKSLENHVEYILRENHIPFEAQTTTERGNRPDFLFPSHSAYIDSAYPKECLRMLGVKSTCKDRWRQVLDEADRIDAKHLLTLEPAISVNQTMAMRAVNLQLVVPKAILSSYSKEQIPYICTFDSFIAELKQLYRM
ncbi:MAG: type II restriction endonuclease [Bacillota bacterium]|nr:type II restriction endonuclease [Bacillota bacterium]